MGMSLPGVEWTAERLRRIPDDGRRYEIVDGVLLVTPSPAFVHQRAVVRLSDLLLEYADSLGLDLMTAPADVAFSKRTVVQPDLFVMPLSATGQQAVQFGDVARLLLAVEVLSPGTARRDREVKRDLYLRQSVAEYWTVDPVARTIERWLSAHSQSEVFRDVMVWEPIPGRGGLTIEVREYFRRVYRE